MVRKEGHEKWGNEEDYVTRKEPVLSEESKERNLNTHICFQKETMKRTLKIRCLHWGVKESTDFRDLHYVSGAPASSKGRAGGMGLLKPASLTGVWGICFRLICSLFFYLFLRPNMCFPLCQFWSHVCVFLVFFLFFPFFFYFLFLVCLRGGMLLVGHFLRGNLKWGFNLFVLFVSLFGKETQPRCFFCMAFWERKMGGKF